MPSPRSASATRRGSLVMVAALGVVAVVALSALTANPAPKPAPAVAPVSTTMAPAMGLLAPTASQLTRLRASGITRVAVGRGWNTLQPARGKWNAVEAAALRRTVVAASRQGAAVILDLGLQYPPSWVFSLPGQTRFVNQYGDAWRGPLSEDVPNAVFNPAVRAAQAAYIARLGRALAGAPVAAVRIGGLLSGELRYPDATYRGHRMSLWMYDRAARAAAPVPGWRPGRGTEAAATASLNYYYASLTNYQTWLMRTVHRAFSRASQQVLFPSWGLRPGFTGRAVADGLRGRTVAEVNGMISAGLDWSRQVRAMKATRIRSTVYTTWLDAPAQGRDAAGVPPVAYLATLAHRYRLPIAGENTGRGGAAAFRLSAARARAFRLTLMMYMSGRLIEQREAGMTFAHFATLTRRG